MSGPSQFFFQQNVLGKMHMYDNLQMSNVSKVKALDFRPCFILFVFLLKKYCDKTGKGQHKIILSMPLQPGTGISRPPYNQDGGD